MRAFGCVVGDLDVDFTSPPLFLITDLLRRCTSLTEEAAWGLPVSARTEAIVDLAIVSGACPLAIVLRCPRACCLEALEVEIEMGELRAVCAGRERDGVSLCVGEHRMELRRPTGRDQRNWLEAHWPNIETARSGMLATLLSAPVSDALDATILTALEAQLANIDPLVAFTLQVACPACGESAEHTVDLERHALAVLRRIHERMFESVARLATRFHWSESEIFALPLWRRERYLALTDGLP